PNRATTPAAPRRRRRATFTTDWVSSDMNRVSWLMVLVGMRPHGTGHSLLKDAVSRTRATLPKAAGHSSFAKDLQCSLCDLLDDSAPCPPIEDRRVLVFHVPAAGAVAVVDEDKSDLIPPREPADAGLEDDAAVLLVEGVDGVADVPH